MCIYMQSDTLVLSPRDAIVVSNMPNNMIDQVD